VRILAERLAKEELAHAALLRTARRLAFREERPDRASPKPVASADTITTLEDLTRAAGSIERHIGQILAEVRRDDPAVAAARAATAKALALLEPGVKTGVASPDRSAGTRGRSALHDAAEWSDLAFSFYDGVVERASSESVLERAQALSGYALDRLVALQRCLETAE
jgi:hypothetical protein